MLLYFDIFVYVPTDGSNGLAVLGVVGGGPVVNGSHSLVVMDCNYAIPRGEEAGLVVTWYKDHNPNPVYQWIMGQQPQVR